MKFQDGPGRVQYEDGFSIVGDLHGFGKSFYVLKLYDELIYHGLFIMIYLSWFVSLVK